MARAISAHRLPEALRALEPGSVGDRDHESLRDASDRGMASGDGRSFPGCSGEESGNHQSLVVRAIGFSRYSTKHPPPVPTPMLDAFSRASSKARALCAFVLERLASPGDPVSRKRGTELFDACFS